MVSTFPFYRFTSCVRTLHKRTRPHSTPLGSRYSTLRSLMASSPQPSTQDLPLPLPSPPPPPQNLLPASPETPTPSPPPPPPPPPPRNPLPPKPKSPTPPPPLPKIPSTSSPPPPFDHVPPQPLPNNHSPLSSPPFSPSRLAIVLRSPDKPTCSPDKNHDSNDASSAVTIGSLLATTDLVVAKAAAANGGGSAKRGVLAPNPWKFRRDELRRFELGLRVSALVLCVISLSLMATDTVPGWAGDSFIRYQEYRFASTSTFLDEIGVCTC